MLIECARYAAVVISWDEFEAMFVQRDADHARQRVISQLQALGYNVTLEAAVA